MQISVNLLSVLIAAVASMAVGFFWYSQAAFGKQWMALKGFTAEHLKRTQNEMGKYYLISFIAAIVTAYMLSHVMTLSQNYYGFPKVMTGLTSAFSIWIGFIMPVQLTATIFGDKNWKLFAIDTGYQLASIVVMGIILGL